MWLTGCGMTSPCRQLLVVPVVVVVVVVDAATFSADSVPELLYPAVVTPSLSSYAVPGFISMH